MPSRLGNIAVGTTLHLQENGEYQDYIVVHQGLPSSMYNSSCNGTWLIRKTIPDTAEWNSEYWGNNTHYYDQSGLKEFMDDWPNVYASDIKAYIKQVTVPCNPDPISCIAFPLSAFELGRIKVLNDETPPDGAVLSYFSGPDAQQHKIFMYNGAAYDWMTRSAAMMTPYPRIVWIDDTGIERVSADRGSIGALPTIIMNPDVLVDDNNNIIASLYPTPPASITVPTTSIPTGSSIAVSWSAVSNVDSYQLQRSANGGSWQTIYTGSETSYSDVAGNWTQVKYRVASVVVGITSGYVTSTTVTVLPYVVDSLTVPSQVMQGQNIPISWTASSAANSYILQRSVNGGGWSQIYSGGNTSYTDTPQSNWTTVQYRVQAGANGSYGAWATSASVPVISASVLVISGTDGDLGTLTADVPYTVSSDTGNPITLERYVNGQLVATTTVESGFAYSIPVMDLPAGAGSIKISATVQTSSGGPVSASRNWTYTKTPIVFPGTGGVAQLSLNSQNVFPVSLAEAIRVPSVWGGSLDLALQLLLPLVGAAVISVGTYTGTGTFGQENPNTLEFPTAPTVVTIYGADKTLAISSTETSGTAYISGNTATWYSETSAADQLNSQGVTYSYVAIRKAATT